VSFGGILGSIIGAYLTEFYDPRYSFGLYSIVSVAIVVCAFLMNKEVEDGLKKIESENATSNSSFMTDLKKNFSDIKLAIKIPEIHKTLAYFVLCGLVTPSFSDFWYFFQMEVVQFSRSTYALLTLLGYISLGLGTLLFNSYFKEFEIRSMM